MNNRRNTEEFLNDEKEIDVKRRKIVSETTPNNIGKILISLQKMLII